MCSRSRRSQLIIYQKFRSPLLAGKVSSTTRGTKIHFRFSDTVYKGFDGAIDYLVVIKYWIQKTRFPLQIFYTDGLIQKSRNSITNALELGLFCITQSMCCLAVIYRQPSEGPIWPTSFSINHAHTLGNDVDISLICVGVIQWLRGLMIICGSE